MSWWEALLLGLVHARSIGQLAFVQSAQLLALELAQRTDHELIDGIGEKEHVLFLGPDRL